jgi:hypothetical protein
MISYLDVEADAGYTERHIDRCEEHLLQFLQSLAENKDPESVRESAKSLVLSLNHLNAKCGGTLIETDQREAICELIIVAARKAGLDEGGDFTEEWREW